MTDFIFNDGGRSAAGFKGFTGDCVVRAIAIATESDYKAVYKALGKGAQEYAENHRGRVARAILRKGASPRDGVFKEVYNHYITEILGWKWKPLMGVGTGCQIHLSEDELPTGRLILRLSKHLAAFVDGQLHDTYDCSRNGTRCVYGYYYDPSHAESFSIAI